MENNIYEYVKSFGYVLFRDRCLVDDNLHEYLSSASSNVNVSLRQEEYLLQPHKQTYIGAQTHINTHTLCLCIKDFVPRISIVTESFCIENTTG